MIKTILVSLALLLNFSGGAQATTTALPPALVYIVPGSDINMVSRESKVPVSIQNDYDLPVRIRVHAKTTNSAMNVQEYVSLTIPANSRKDALLPVTALSSGSYTMRVWVTTFTDLRLGVTNEIHITANPNVELYLLVAFGLLIFILVIIGVLRMRSKRRNI